MKVIDFRRMTRRKVRKDAFTMNGSRVPTARNKYGNRRVERHGIVFDSILEADRWDFLSLLERQGVIGELRRQVTFVLFPDEYKDVIVHLKTKDKVVRRLVMKGITYRADFEYVKVSSGETVVEDTKGMVTREFELKAKMMHFIHHVDVRLVRKATEGI